MLDYMASACFVGHKQLTYSMELEEDIINVISMLTSVGVFDFFVGGSCGFELYCSKIILQLREDDSNIKLHMIIPCSEEEQIKKWVNAGDKTDYHSVLTQADTIERCSKNYYNGCYKEMNKRLIEQSDICVCYYDKGKKYYSSTGQSVRMAKRKKMRILNLFND